MDKQQIIDLWRSSFNDTDEFVQLFFDRVYKEENTLAIEKDGKVVSALQMLPYTMTYYGKEISVSYIYGACTLPSERGQGHMRALIQEAFQVMEHRDVALTVIVPSDPWLFDYYRELGYTEAFDYSENEYIRSSEAVWEPDLTVVPPEVPSTTLLYAYFDRKLRERACCMLHTADDFITILRDLQLSGGQMLTALNEQEQPVGMVFVFPAEATEAGEHVYIKELLYDDERIKKLLLQEATAQNKVTKAVYRCPSDGPGNLPFGMARVLDKNRLIRHWFATHGYSPLTSDDLNKMDIEALTRLLLDYPAREAYMSMMLD